MQFVTTWPDSYIYGCTVKCQNYTSCSTMALTYLLCTLGGPVRRRPLHSDANRHVVPVLAGLVNEILGSIAANTVLPPGSGVCRPCLRRVEKLMKLREDLELENERLCQHLKRAGEACGLHSHQQELARETTSTAESSGGTTPSRKRPATTATQDTPAKK